MLTVIVLVQIDTTLSCVSESRITSHESRGVGRPTEESLVRKSRKTKLKRAEASFKASSSFCRLFSAFEDKISAANH